jgi:hypothetical protein
MAYTVPCPPSTLLPLNMKRIWRFGGYHSPHNSSGKKKVFTSASQLELLIEIPSSQFQGFGIVTGHTLNNVLRL